MRKIQSQKDVDAVEKILTLRKRILSCDDTCERSYRDVFDDLKENEESTCEMLSRRNPILDEIVEHFNDDNY